MKSNFVHATLIIFQFYVQFQNVKYFGKVNT
jgi:hypothetical protein